MPARTGCCAECCRCSFLDTIWPDANGSTITEQITSQGNSSHSVTSEQLSSDGSNITCSGREATADEVPCRRVAIEYTQDPSLVTSSRCGIDLGSVLDPSWAVFYGVKTLDFVNGLDQYNYHLPGAQLPFSAVLTGSGTSLTLTITNTSDGKSVTYTATGEWRADWGITSASASGGLTFSRVGSTLAFATPAIVGWTPGLWVGVGHGVIWWRFYSATAWTPDGTDPRVGWCQDDYCLIQSVDGYDGADPVVSELSNNRFSLCMKQGSHLAWADNGPDWYTTTFGDRWFQNGFPARRMSEIGWSELGAAFAPVAFSPDLSIGAPPITFGICRVSGASGGVRNVSENNRLDRFCFRRLR